MTTRHNAVMIADVLRYLLDGETRTVVDATLGAGDHAEAILSAHDALILIGIDRDPSALDIATRRLSRFGARFRAVRSEFADIASVLSDGGPVDGILADLGVSSMQIDDVERGFSYRGAAALDMRMSSSGETAAELIARTDADGIARMLRDYGDVTRPRRLAAAIARASAQGTLTTTQDLRRVVEEVFGYAAQPSLLSRVFQAFRLAVNHEIDQLHAFLPAAAAALAPGGRIAVISYHSLEDRAVKRFFREESRGCVCPPDLPVCVCGHTPRLDVLTRRAVVPSGDEVARNSRARSARLRVARAVDTGGGR